MGRGDVSEKKHEDAPVWPAEWLVSLNVDWPVREMGCFEYKRAAFKRCENKYGFAHVGG